MGRTTVYNKNLTTSWDSVCKQNKQFVTDYILYLKSNDKSPETIKQYYEWLKIFFCWNYTENADKLFVDLKRRDFVYYFGWCRNKNMSSNRVAALKSVLSSLSTEIELLYEDVYPQFHNQLRSLEPVHISTVREKTVISVEKMFDILTKLIALHKYQEACYLALACASGSRKSELLQMKTSFFTPESEVFGGLMYCTPEIRTKGRGKRGKVMKKYVLKELFKPFFDLWMDERSKLGITAPELFIKIGEECKPATVSTVNSFTSKISKIGGIDYYTHSSRHFFCTFLKQKKLPDDIVRMIIGWESTELIKIYDDTPANDKLEEFFKNCLLSLKPETEEVKGE